MNDKLDDIFMMRCLRCGYSFNPYAKDLNLYASIEEAFFIWSKKPCPVCGEKHWTHNF